MVGVLVVKGRTDVGPVVAERGSQLLLRGDQHLGVLPEQVEQRPEALDRQELGHVGALGGVLERRDLGQLAVLGGQLGGGRDLDLLGVAQRALGEGREPAQRLDLFVEQIDAHGTLLGGGEHVEQPAAHRELAALLDLVDALVARAHEVGGGLLQVEQLTDAQREGVGPQRRVGDLLREGHGRDHHHRGLHILERLREQGVERGHAQAHEVRGRRQMRLVGHAARGVEAHPPRCQPGAQVGREVAGGAIVAHDHQRGPQALGPAHVGQRGQQVGAQRARHEGVTALLGERERGGILLDEPEQRAQGRHRLERLGFEQDALDLGAGAIHELLDRGGALAEAPQHVRGDDLGVGRVGAPHADPYAHELGAPQLAL